MARRAATDLLAAYARGDLRSTLAGVLSFLARYAVEDLAPEMARAFSGARAAAGRWALREAEGLATAGDTEGAERMLADAERCLHGTEAAGEVEPVRSRVLDILGRLAARRKDPPPEASAFDRELAAAKRLLEAGDLEGAAKHFALASPLAAGPAERRSLDQRANTLVAEAGKRRTRAERRRTADAAVRAGDYGKGRAILTALAEEARVDPEADPAESRRDEERGSAVTDLEENRELPVLASVRQGLRWMVKQQLPDGSFGWTAVEAKEKGLTEEKRSTHQHRTGLTGLAALALLGHVRFDITDEFEPTLRKAVDWLLAWQKADGSFPVSTTNQGVNLYHHSIVTAALVDMDRLLHDTRVRPAAAKAIRWLQDAANQDAGWRYSPRGPTSDVSVTGWALQALLHARAAHYDVGGEDPVLRPGVIDGAMAYVDRMTQQDGRVGYDKPTNPGSAAMTAAALFCRLRYDQGLGDARVQAAADFVVKRLPKPGWGENSYFLFYASDGMSRLGGTYWKAWGPALQKYLLDLQVKEGDSVGAWPTKGDAWAQRDDGGAVYQCAMHCLALENFFDHRD